VAASVLFNFEVRSSTWAKPMVEKTSEANKPPSANFEFIYDSL
jgi:hypothetical protein